MREALFTCVIGLFIGACVTSTLIGMNSELYKCDPMKSDQLVKLPGWDNAWQVTKECSAAHPEEVSIAMKIFYMHWLEMFGDSSQVVKVNLHRMMIFWGNQFKVTSGYTIDGSYRKNLRAQGLTQTKGMIWVKKSPETKICESSLTHELVHASIWALKIIDGDPDHLGKKYRGWTIDHSALVQNVKTELCRLGI
jgi:hypothetical protein